MIKKASIRVGIETQSPYEVVWFHSRSYEGRKLFVSNFNANKDSNQEILG